MSSREEILKRVRAGIGKDDFARRKAVAEAYIAAHKRGPQPIVGKELAARFQAKAEYLSSTVELIESMSDVPSAVARYLAGLELGVQAVVTPDVARLPWAGAGLDVRAGVAVDADKVGISGCFCAIAETGTLLLLSGPASPATVSLLPETHIALVPVSRIVATMEDAFALHRAERGCLPRAANFISGPSRTGDIEQTIVLGAHGPCRVHLVMVKKGF
jgi:L-lactate dehydrogenase complex protein LldG